MSETLLLLLVAISASAGIDSGCALKLLNASHQCSSSSSININRLMSDVPMRMLKYYVCEFHRRYSASRAHGSFASLYTFRSWHSNASGFVTQPQPNVKWIRCPFEMILPHLWISSVNLRNSITNFSELSQSNVQHISIQIKYRETSAKHYLEHNFY